MSRYTTPNGPEKCQAFALCPNAATRLEPHPILLIVPVCERCHNKLRTIK